MKYTQPTERERYQLEALMQTCSTQKMIAEALGRNKSTVSRELKRNIKTRKVWKSAVRRKLISERPSKVAKCIVQK